MLYDQTKITRTYKETCLTKHMFSRVASTKGSIASERRLGERGDVATSANGRFASERPCGERGRCAAASAPELRHA